MTSPNAATTVRAFMTKPCDSSIRPPELERHAEYVGVTVRRVDRYEPHHIDSPDSL
jgi:hypothetical protein